MSGDAVDQVPARQTLAALNARWGGVEMMSRDLAVTHWGKWWILIDGITGSQLGPLHGRRRDAVEAGEDRIARGDYR